LLQQLQRRRIDSAVRMSLLSLLLQRNDYQTKRNAATTAGNTGLQQLKSFQHAFTNYTRISNYIVNLLAYRPRNAHCTIKHFLKSVQIQCSARKSRARPGLMLHLPRYTTEQSQRTACRSMAAPCRCLTAAQHSVYRYRPCPSQFCQSFQLRAYNK
jgi:hypothetical protein